MADRLDQLLGRLSPDPAIRGREFERRALARLIRLKGDWGCWVSKPVFRAQLRSHNPKTTHVALAQATLPTPQGPAEVGHGVLPLGANTLLVSRAFMAQVAQSCQLPD